MDRDADDDEEILQRVLRDHFGDSFAPDEAEVKEMRATVKAIQEKMARRKKSLQRQWLARLSTKDEESGNQAVIGGGGGGKESLEQVLKDKLDMLDLEEDPKRTAEPAADPSSATIQDDHVERAKSALAKKTADDEARAFNVHRDYWRANCCNNCDHFDHKTVVSSMVFTHCTPGIVPHGDAETLQIFSVKLKLADDNAGGFEFPLSVFGMVAVRDDLDSRRNIIFACCRSEAQELTQDDPFLGLTGPSRAILSQDMVYFEIYLRVKGATSAQDKPLITRARRATGYRTAAAVCFSNVLCTLEVCLQTVERAVQATIVGAQIVTKKDLWPSNFIYGGLVACTPLPRSTAGSGGSQKVVLIESKGRDMPQGDAGYVRLRRQVVSVECGGGLDVVVQAYNKSGGVAAEGHVHFTAQKCHMSQQQCIVGPTQVNVCVAWSAVPTDMDDLVYSF